MALCSQRPASAGHEGNIKEYRYPYSLKCSVILNPCPFGGGGGASILLLFDRPRGGDALVYISYSTICTKRYSKYHLDGEISSVMTKYIYRTSL